MKGNKHQICKKKLCCNLCWKLPEGAQSFVFCWKIVTE